MPGRRGRSRTGDYTSRRSAIRKTLPGLKIPLPTTPANKARITRLHKSLFGGQTRSGKRIFGLTRSSEGYSRNTFKTESEAKTVARQLGVKAFGRSVITPPGRVRMVLGQTLIKRNGLTFIPVPVSREGLVDDPSLEAERIAGKIGRNQRAQMFIGNHAVPRYFDRQTFAEAFEQYVSAFAAKYPEAIGKLRVEIIQLSKQRKGSLDDAIATYSRKQTRKKIERKTRKKNRGRRR